MKPRTGESPPKETGYKHRIIRNAPRRGRLDRWVRRDEPGRAGRRGGRRCRPASREPGWAELPAACGHPPLHRARGSGGRERCGPCPVPRGGENFSAGIDFVEGMRQRLDPGDSGRAYRFLADQKVLCDKIRGLRIPTVSVARGLCAGSAVGHRGGGGLPYYRCDHADPAPGSEGRTRPRKRRHLVSPAAHGARGGQVLRSDRIPHEREAGGRSGSGPGVRGRRHRGVPCRAPESERTPRSTPDPGPPGKEGGHAGGPREGGSRAYGEDRPALRVRAGQPGVPGGHLRQPGGGRGGRGSLCAGIPGRDAIGLGPGGVGDGVSHRHLREGRFLHGGRSQGAGAQVRPGDDRRLRPPGGRPRSLEGLRVRGAQQPSGSDRSVRREGISDVDPGHPRFHGQLARGRRAFHLRRERVCPSPGGVRLRGAEPGPGLPGRSRPYRRLSHRPSQFPVVGREGRRRTRRAPVADGDPDGLARGTPRLADPPREVRARHGLPVRMEPTAVGIPRLEQLPGDPPLRGRKDQPHPGDLRPARGARPSGRAPCDQHRRRPEGREERGRADVHLPPRSGGRSIAWRTSWSTWGWRGGTWSSSTCPRTSSG